jgi:hypothetical protein
MIYSCCTSRWNWWTRGRKRGSSSPRLPASAALNKKQEAMASITPSPYQLIWSSLLLSFKVHCGLGSETWRGACILNSRACSTRRATCWGSCSRTCLWCRYMCSPPICVCWWRFGTYTWDLVHRAYTCLMISQVLAVFVCQLFAAGITSLIKKLINQPRPESRYVPTNQVYIHYLTI